MDNLVNELYYVRFFKDNIMNPYRFGIFDNWDDIKQAQSNLSKQDNIKYNIKEMGLNSGLSNTLCVSKIEINKIITRL